MSNQELFRQIRFIPQYEISNLGRVRSKRTTKVLSQIPDKFGYRRVCLRENGKRKYFFVHRLVLIAFREECPLGYQCNHIDGNHANNDINNLEWVTAKENMAHAIRTGLSAIHKGESHNRAKLKTFQVIEIKRLLLAGGNTNVEIAKKFNISPELISRIKNGRNWSHVVLPGREVQV